MKIVLVGMPASGKSTFGKQLAQKYNYSFIDLDEFIEQSKQQSISNIFKEKGESGFRKIEQKALHKALSFEKTVLATGGGTPCFFDNMTLINRKGTSIFLKAPLLLLAQRLWKDASSHRPLYKAENLEDLRKMLTQVYQKRRRFYEKAKITKNIKA